GPPRPRAANQLAVPVAAADLRARYARQVQLLPLRLQPALLRWRAAALGAVHLLRAAGGLPAVRDPADRLGPLAHRLAAGRDGCAAALQGRHDPQPGIVRARDVSPGSALLCVDAAGDAGLLRRGADQLVALQLRLQLPDVLSGPARPLLLGAFSRRREGGRS